MSLDIYLRGHLIIAFGSVLGDRRSARYGELSSTLTLVILRNGFMINPFSELSNIQVESLLPRSEISTFLRTLQYFIDSEQESKPLKLSIVEHVQLVQAVTNSLEFVNYKAFKTSPLGTSAR